MFTICAELPGLRAGTDAALALLVPVEEIEVGNVRLAFDHERIVRDAVERTRSRLEYTALAMVAPSAPLERALARRRRPTWPQAPVMSGPPPDASEVDTAPSAEESDPPPPGEAISPPKKDDKT